MILDVAIAQSLATLRARAGKRAPHTALVLGSGWGSVADLITDAVDVPYRDLPAFPVLGVGGHSGALRLGRIGKLEVAVLAGRKHAYEDGQVDGMKGAIRTLAAFGVRVLVQTNAAGSIDAAMGPGELMLITDHINLPQRSPLFGDSGDTRFVDMGHAYDLPLRELALDAAASQGITLHEGVYAWAMGPQFETPAEIRMLRICGANAVGMSTVPETILARHAGMRVLALSMLTNMAAGMDAGLDAHALSHAHTLASAKHGSARAAQLVRSLLATLEV